MAGGVGQVELLGCGGIAADMKEDTADAIGCLNDGLIDGTRLGGMLVSHFKSIVPELVEAIGPYLFIADIYPCGKTGKVDVDPVRIFRNAVEKAAIADDRRIYGIIETIWKAGAVEGLILMWGEVDPEITASLGCKGAITGQQ